ncbi:hypothetical protein [Roseofilum capinflatum]|uniref:Uncharacterized protein n=1 Tax=Roseofilum capinflatum BLCC-M114 TaxID=3022440 RepID=A0ABT7B2E0_9CYAN|nr:hypothetical protein [Roseofilum capinflatum]MDJ1173300.1 hypothetical protein [Roseofilum capinflatum BLCC-M114]
MFWGESHPAQAQCQYQNPGVPFPFIGPLDTQLVEAVEESKPVDLSTGAVITENTIQEGRLTLPSLWWASEQYGKDLLVTWLAYPPRDEQTPGEVHLVVNRQVWRETSYFNRYELLTKMGAIARDYGYNTRLFNRQGDTLGSYTCNFNTPNFCNVEGLITSLGVNENCIIYPSNFLVNPYDRLEE